MPQTCANNIVNPGNGLFGVKIFNPFPSFTSSSSPSTVGKLSNYSSSSNSFFYSVDSSLSANSS